MNKTFKIILRTTLVVLLGGMVSCGDEKPPASQAQVVSKKIKMEQAKPAQEKVSTAPLSVDKASPMPSSDDATSKVETATEKVIADSSEKGVRAPAEAETETPVAKVAPVTSELIKATLEIASSYDPTGRFDPFEPLFSDEPEAPLVRASTSKKKKRAPQTPLEKVAISQLKLTAILRMPQGNRALVEDATGKGYVVKKGTYMGLNAGQVIRIDKNSVLVEEEIQNMVGEYIINNTELKLQKTAGEQ